MTIEPINIQVEDDLREKPRSHMDCAEHETDGSVGSDPHLYTKIENGFARLNDLTEKVSKAAPRRKKKIAKHVTLAEPIAVEQQVSTKKSLTTSFAHLSQIRGRLQRTHHCLHRQQTFHPKMSPLSASTVDGVFHRPTSPPRQLAVAGRNAQNPRKGLTTRCTPRGIASSGSDRLRWASGLLRRSQSAFSGGWRSTGPPGHTTQSP